MQSPNSYCKDKGGRDPLLAPTHLPKTRVLNSHICSVNCSRPCANSYGHSNEPDKVPDEEMGPKNGSERHRVCQKRKSGSVSTCQNARYCTLTLQGDQQPSLVPLGQDQFVQTHERHAMMHQQRRPKSWCWAAASRVCYVRTPA